VVTAHILLLRPLASAGTDRMARTVGAQGRGVDSTSGGRRRVHRRLKIKLSPIGKLEDDVVTRDDLRLA
jgi:hypothetical protein